jgi:glucokinase
VRLIPAIDLGGTYAKGAVIDQSGALRFSDSVPTPAEHGSAAVLDAVAAFGERLLAEARGMGGNPDVFGLAIPGIVDEDRGVGVFSANIGWRDLPVRDHIAERLGVPVVLSHDVRAGGVAEAVLGAGRGAGSVLTVPIGTGIAGAYVIDGQPYRGAHGAALELGHIPVPGFDGPCPCGRRGCLERYASASAIGERYRRAAAEAGIPEDEHIGAHLVQARAQSGEQLAQQIWSSAVSAIADALIIATTLLDPDRIVIAGGLSLAGEFLLAPLRDRFNTVPTMSGEVVDILPAELGSQAGVIGAAWLADNQR